jgi:hypothetical protein
MAKNRSKQPTIRKPVYVVGGIVLGVAVLGFVLMNFIGRGDGGGDTAVPSSSPSAVQTAPPSAPTVPSGNESPQELRPGGRDPFEALVAASAGGGAPAPEPTAAPAPTDAPTSPSRYVALVKAGKCQALPTDEPHTLEEVIAHQNECLAANPE